MGKKPRSSLSEDILIGQLEEHEHHTKTSSEEATPTDHTPNEMRKQESVESESKTPEEGSPSMVCVCVLYWRYSRPSIIRTPLGTKPFG